MLVCYLAGVPKRLQIIQGPDNITVGTATEVSMRCTVHGFPVPMVHWFKDGCLLTNCSASFSLHNNGQLLTFRSDTRNINSSLLCFSCKILMTNQTHSLGLWCSKSVFTHTQSCFWAAFQECDQGGWRLVSLWSIQPERVDQVSSSLSSYSWYFTPTSAEIQII